MKRGRPPIPTSQRKAAGISLRLTDEERARVLDLAGTANLEPSEWIRSKLLGEKQPAPQPTTILDWRSVGIYVVTPEPMTVENWKMLSRYVCEVLKPAE